MTPEANTIFTICLFLGLGALLEWSKRRIRSAVRLRRGLAVALSYDRRGDLSSFSARSQSSSAEPPARPLASQNE